MPSMAPWQTGPVSPSTTTTTTTSSAASTPCTTSCPCTTPSRSSSARWIIVELQGWMDMARARYSMGPSRISQPLFSLKPYSASAQLLSLASPDDNLASPSHMSLVRLDAGKTNSLSANSDSHTSPKRQGSPQDLPRSKTGVRPDWSPDEDVAYRRLMAGEGDSDSDSETAIENQANEQTRPLRWFGALVSPHLQAAQTSFELALEILVKIANAQREALHAHNQVMQQRGDMILDEPSSPEAQGHLL